MVVKEKNVIIDIGKSFLYHLSSPGPIKCCVIWLVNLLYATITLFSVQWAYHIVCDIYCMQQLRSFQFS